MSKKRVLMVDDEVSFTRMTKITLEVRGQYSVEVVNEPSEAISAARRFKPEIILLDFIMPGMDGANVASQFQTEPELRDIPIIFLTATARGEEATRDGLISGGYRFLSKPIAVTDLMRCMETCVAEKESHPAPDPLATGAAAEP
jgi:CheY-like chemotaxis protein